MAFPSGVQTGESFTPPFITSIGALPATGRMKMERSCEPRVGAAEYAMYRSFGDRVTNPSELSALRPPLRHHSTVRIGLKTPSETDNHASSKSPWLAGW